MQRALLHGIYGLYYLNCNSIGCVGLHCNGNNSACQYMGGQFFEKAATVEIVPGIDEREDSLGG